MSGLLGWPATAVTAGSYLSRQAATLKKVQAAGACIWIIYGVNIEATPVIVANLVVGAMAFYSSLAERSTWKQQWSARLNRRFQLTDSPDEVRRLDLPWKKAAPVARIPRWWYLCTHQAELRKEHPM